MAWNFGVNLTAVIFAAIVAMVIGFAYYSPRTMASRWMSKLNPTGAQLPSPGPSGIGVGAGAAFLNAWVLAVIALNLGATGVGAGIVLGFLCWLGFMATVTAAAAAFATQPWGLWLVNNIHNVVVQIVMAAIVTVWR